LYLGIPATSVVSPGNTAFLTTTSFTATGGQTTFTPSSTYQVGFINVIRNGSQLAPADFTATNGTTVVLNNACVAGDTVVTQGYTLSSISNALPLTGGTVTGTTTFSGASTFTNQVTINGGSASGFTGFKNRIINGGMVIDQRNAGAAQNSIASGAFMVDRWIYYASQASKFNAQQNQGSVTPPAGFTNYQGLTVSSAVSIGAGDYFFFVQNIEGFNTADLAWGTASAATVTLSFWVRSSLTGTFGGTLRNSAVDRSYPFTYTISSANTWEQKSITIPGDTTGTWLTNNGVGITLILGLGVGSTYSGTAGAWAATNLFSATGATSVVGTNGATFYITGVQLERGSNATSFEFRDYGRELIMCQRYYWKVTTPLAAVASGVCVNTTISNQYMKFPVSMRAAPVITQSSTYVNIGSASVSVTSLAAGYVGIDSALVQPSTASGLVSQAGAIWIINAGYVDGTSEL
jgi:hypothetical protein